MSCPNDLSYPSYINSIISEIKSGTDDELKACLCVLKNPLNEDGCPILDEDAKAGLFPFCVSEATDQVGNDSDYPLKLTLKQAMNLYWKVTSWNFSANSKTTACGCKYTKNFNGNKTQPNPLPEMKKRVCHKNYIFLTNYSGVNCCPDCSNVNGEDLVIATLFSGNPPMKYKKEGGVYYFYPKFSIQFYNYAICTSQSQAAANSCIGENYQPLSPGDITIKILDSEVNFKYYKAKWQDRNGCSYNANSYISNLKFI